MVKVPKGVSYCTVEDSLTSAGAWSDLPESIIIFFPHLSADFDFALE